MSSLKIHKEGAKAPSKEETKTAEEKAAAKAKAQTEAVKAALKANKEREEKVRKENEKISGKKKTITEIEEEAKKTLEKVRVSATPVAVAEEKETVSVGETSVIMLFPKDVMLHLNDGSKIKYAAGVNTVPVSLKDHWYLKANGVKEYNPDAD